MESINIPRGSDRKAIYESLLPQIKALTGGEPDLIANLANIMAALKQAMGFFWIGIYIVRDNDLVVGPFQGPVACTRIEYGKGVCGAAWRTAETIIVDDVNTFPGHIACNAESKSEIVVPVIRKNKVIAVIDIDSDKLSDFEQADADALKQVAELISSIWS
jgi:L-methionine (R)-S-oxide reductase